MKRFGPFFILPVVLSACSEAPPLELRFESEHYIYYSPEPVCSDLPQELEKVHGVLAGYLEAEPEGRVEYRQESYAGEGCEGSGSCYKSGTIHSVFPIHPHEIVHAISDPVGDPPFLFEEGLAEVLGCIGNSGWPTILEKPDIRDLFESDEFAAVRDNDLPGTYAIAASFVRFLIDKLGKEAFLDLYGSLSFSDSRETVTTALEAAFGSDFDQIDAEWQQRIESSDMHCINLALCDSEELQGATLKTPECSLMVFGQARRTFTIEEETFAFRTQVASSGGFGSIESCSGGTIGSGLMDMTTPSLVDDSQRLETTWFVRATPGKYSWASNFVEREYEIDPLSDSAPISLGADNRAVLLGRFLDGTVGHSFTADVSGQLYATQVREGDSPPFEVEVCIDGDCATVALEGGAPSVDLGAVAAGAAFDVTVSSPTFNGAVGAALAIRPD